jgi:hypothetical protein
MLYHAFVERVSAFAAWLLILSAAMSRWPPVGRKLTHYRERGMEYLRDSRSFAAARSRLSNPSEVSKCFPQASHTVPSVRSTLLGAGSSAMIVAMTSRKKQTNSRITDK